VIVFIGDYVRRGDLWLQVVDIGAGDMVQLENKEWVLACDTEIDELLSENEYNGAMNIKSTQDEV
jgi:hypothetical protein|tara:strand:+ start:40 stop:234 length:195 start_codon:yes stop_codon:yes gene_type:complete